MSLYSELYTRNQPLIESGLQTKVSELIFCIAGCGSTGGAAIDGLMRLGVQHYILADNGTYETNNLNRQMVFLESIGQNKASVQKNRILALNPEAKVSVEPLGITDENCSVLLQQADLIFDAIDVTTPEGMRLKLELHKQAHQLKKPVLSALDLGLLQWVRGYNYQMGDDLLGGRYERAVSTQHPLKALLIGFCPLENLPLDMTEELLRLLQKPEESACQLAAACFLLSALMTPLTLHWLSTKKLPTEIRLDLLHLFDEEDVRAQKLSQKKQLDAVILQILEKL